jgi:hypothetical protein
MSEKSTTIDSIRKIMSQTTYNEEVAREKLDQFNGDFMRVIRDYMGIPEKRTTKPIKSLNQEIYKQIRHTLDTAMTEHRQKNPLDLEQATKNLQESEDRQKGNT